ncbi:cell envelope opacity-associated protein [Escherichia coli]|uniref:Cell envelope opacity-associated protein n=1 Tax=Escherichia coli TaxID=562 RepID=A0A376U199_ECOLX|nr:cell envelope opacity-associated protein [Escherichia coli]
MILIRWLRSLQNLYRKASQKSSRKLPKRNHSSQIAELIINGALTRVEPGKTMAQLFRDHGLPATDVYAMAQVEGAGKPLSNLQNGQMVKIRQNASGVVTGLTIDTGNNQQVLFTRQPDGSFIRAR